MKTLAARKTSEAKRARGRSAKRRADRPAPTKSRGPVPKKWRVEIEDTTDRRVESMTKRLDTALATFVTEVKRFENAVERTGNDVYFCVCPFDVALSRAHASVPAHVDGLLGYILNELGRSADAARVIPLVVVEAEEAIRMHARTAAVE